MTGSWRAGWPALVVSTAARLVLGAAALLVAVSVVLPLLTGWQSSVVMSGSMAPTLRPGDVVVVRPVDAADLRAGDVVLVDDPDLPGQLRMHRVVAVGAGGLRLRGDAAPAADTSLVAPAAVHGVGTLRLPGLGLPALWAREGRPAPLVLAGAGLAALLALAVAHRAQDDESRRRRRTARPVALGAVAVVLVGLPGTADARAVFSATTATPANNWTAGSYWTCAGAASAAGAAQYYGLQETSGTTATNGGSLGSAANGTYSSTGVTYGVPGPRCGAGAPNAVRLDGASGQLWTARASTNPQTFSEQIWFSTTTTSGGLLMGFGDGASGALSGNYDRHIVMTNAGNLAFGVYDGGATHEITSAASYNDGRWHLATATFSGTAGMTLYVDGAQVARDATSTVAQNFTGYWRVGYDNVDNWPSTPTSRWFAGSVAHAAVFPTVLSATEVANQYGAGPWTCATAAGSSGAGAVQYYGLQETAGPTATNGGSAGSAGNGTYAGGITFGVPGPACGPGGNSAIRLDGSSGYLWTTRSVTAPQNFTVQIWFATTTVRGGKLIGFGSGANGAQSSQFDRHIYMTNGGQLAFGVYNGTHYTVTSTAAYNDGRWHLATGTFSPGTGLAFYVDGTLIGTNTQTTAAENSTGYWRIGFDSLGSWPNAPTSAYFAGSVAHAVVVDRVLTADEVGGQYTAGH